MNPFIRSLMRPPAVIVVAAGLVLAGVGWLGTGVVLVLAGAGVALYRSRRPEVLLETALGGLSVVVDPQMRAQLGELAGTLRSARSISGAEQLGMQAYDQLGSLTGAFVAYRKVLGQRFSGGELTYGRYLKAGEQVFLAALDDLQRAAQQLQGLATVDIDQVRAKLRILERNDSPSAAESRELETLRERLSLREEEDEAVRALLASNEQALTQLSAAHAALGRVKTQAGMAAIESEAAMQQLEEMSSRAARYAIDAPGERQPVRR